MPGYDLSYVALAARDVDSVCKFFGESLRLTRSDATVGGQSVPFFFVGRSAVAVFDVEDPYLGEATVPGVHHIALSCKEPREAARRHGLDVVSEVAGPSDRRCVAVAKRDTAGIRTRFIEPGQGAADAPAADQGPTEPLVYKLDHIGIATDDNDASVAVFAGNLGCAVESTQTDVEVRHVTESFVSDKYGAVYHARPPEVLGGLRDVFINVGDCELELLMDYDARLEAAGDLGNRQGTTKGDQSAIARFVARHGPGLAHIAFATRDIDAVLARLAGDGWRLIDEAGRPGGRGSLIGFVHPSNFGGGLVMHFVEPQADGGYGARRGRR